MEIMQKYLFIWSVIAFNLENGTSDLILVLNLQISGKIIGTKNTPIYQENLLLHCQEESLGGKVTMTLLISSAMLLMTV